MKVLNLNDLRNNQKIINKVKLEITPEILFQPLFPRTTEGYQEKVKEREGYMFYIEIVNSKPTLMVMNTFQNMSVTVGWIEGVPEELLRDAVENKAKECKAGMYPIDETLKEWLKKELGL
ncbi:MAG: hypothetical protein HZC12_03845 [Nitrospirae bacterium]|nr:hypothetical protein [Nitrospirota bacterium]